MDQEHLRDLFAGVAPITMRRMFGGYGIYHDGAIFAVVLDDRLLLKGDAETAQAYEAAGMERWIYPHAKNGKPVAMPYWTAPDTALDDPDEMRGLAQMALGAARRSAR